MLRRTANPDTGQQPDGSDPTARLLAEKGHAKGLPELPGGYYLEREPNVLVLRRMHGSLAPVFSSRGGAPEAVRWAVEETAHGEAFAGRRGLPSSAASPARPILWVNFFGRFKLLRDGQIVPCRP